MASGVLSQPFKVDATRIVPACRFGLHITRFSVTTKQPIDGCFTNAKHFSGFGVRLGQARQIRANDSFSQLDRNSHARFRSQPSDKNRSLQAEVPLVLTRKD